MDTASEQFRSALTGEWKNLILEAGADFVYFTDISSLPEEATEGFDCAVLFGKALSREYLRAVRDGIKPKTKEIFNTERKMDALSEKLAAKLNEAGYKSVGKLKSGQLPHKTVALRAGLGFIGKNNLLVTPEYGCALMLGKVLTQAPFITSYEPPKLPQCGSCRVCTEACEPGALLGKEWSIRRRELSPIRPKYRYFRTLVRFLSCHTTVFLRQRNTRLHENLSILDASQF
ncbi:MAG: epoxyqueuosine reductase [Clostridiales bacterium]|jgi:epoxyqueuosine reductase QueG|nr:epoxyqueuosine reductase [Clostridiales bacterium]